MPQSLAEMLTDARTQVAEVTPTDAAKEIAAGSVVVLDVREPAEADEHIDGAVQIPRGLLEFAADPASPRHHPDLDPTGRVIVYCRSGARAALAGTTLQAMGYTDVVNLTGGFGAWKDAGLPTAEHHAGL